MRYLALLLTILIASSAHSAGVGGVGVAFKANTNPEYILVVGDPQVGGNCTGYGWGSTDDATHQACGQAQVDATEEIILDAFTRYRIGYGVIAGDLIDNVNRTWARTQLQAMLTALPSGTRSKLNVVSGNHDSTTSNCNALDNHLSTDFGTDGGIAQMYWSKRLRRTRIIGFSDSVSGSYYAVPCHAQDDPLLAISSWPQAACFGDESLEVGAANNNFQCTVDGDCRSGQCGTWEDYHQGQMDFVAAEFGKFKATGREETLVVVGHQALCRNVVGTVGCENTYNDAGDDFDRLQDMYVCNGSSTDSGKYCNQTISTMECQGDVAYCDTPRTGFQVRDDMIALIEGFDPAKQGIVWASGHVGESVPEPTAATNQLDNAIGVDLPFLKAEAVGPHAVEMTENEPQGLVIKVPHNGPPEIVEYLTAENQQPVFIGGTVTLDPSDSDTISATDPDYGIISYYLPDLSGTEFDGGCLALSNSSISPLGTITSTACTASTTYGPYTICATDYLNGTGDGTTSPGLEACASVTVSIN